MPQQAVWGKGFLERCLELVIDLRQANFIFTFQQAVKKCCNHQRLNRKYGLDFQGLKKYSSRDTFSIKPC
jgi:hypothetical protein